MNRTNFVLLAIAASTATFHAQAETRSFRCNRDLVKLGDSKATTLSKCGEPVIKDAFCKKNEPVAVTSPGNKSTTVVNTGCETVDEWTYNPGSGQFMTTLRFEAGALTEIKYGKRVN